MMVVSVCLSTSVTDAETVIWFDPSFYTIVEMKKKTQDIEVSIFFMIPMQTSEIITI